MHYFCLSFTHKNTDIKLREKISLNSEIKSKEIQKLICANKYIDECLVLSTCNRVEILCVAKQLEQIKEYIINCLCIVTRINSQLIYDRPDVYEDIGCVHHIFSVASSLDSLVIGETQIVGQLKDAFESSFEENYAKTNLAKLIKSALKCAADVRNKTSISKNPVSISSVATLKAKEIGNFSNALVIGAGLMGELACKHLIASNINVLILNKTQKKADELAIRLGDKAKSGDLQMLKKYLSEYALIFCATSSQNAIITDEIIEKTSFKRYFFDIALPKDVDLSQECLENFNIEVFNVDDLQDIVKRNLSLREEQANTAYKIISENVREFYKMLSILSSKPLIKKLYISANECLENEYKKAIKKKYLQNSDKNEAYKFAKQFQKAFLHSFAMKLKGIYKQKNSNAIIESMQYFLDVSYEDLNENMQTIEIYDSAFDINILD